MRLGFAATLAALCLGSAHAQEPVEPPAPDMPDVVPAQFQTPPGRVADPPPPVVRVQIRVPAAVAPKSTVRYTISVRNDSPATAHRVSLRHPLPDGAGQPTFDPRPDNWDGKSPPPKAFEWAYPELPAGKSRMVTATYVAGDKVKQLRAEAFVSFEHGESVVTQILTPRLTLTKSAPERALAGDPVPVRVDISNSGGVPVEGVELLETLPPDAEFRGDGDKMKTPGQRVWKLGTLMPGERRSVPYQVVAKGAGELLTMSSVSGNGATAGEPKESRTKIDTAGVAVILTGPGRVEAGGVGEYVATVTNTGTVPLSAVRVRAQVPTDCRPTAMSAGGRLLREELIWDGPPDRERGPLRAGEKFEVTCKLRSVKAGERTVRVFAEAPRTPEQSAEAKTRYEGGSQLQGVADIAPGLIATGGTGQLKYTVTNSGDALARGVVVTVAIPDGVSVSKVPARARQTGAEIRFDPTDLVPGSDAVYTLEFRGEKPAQAVFEFQVTEAGGARGLRATKEVAVTPARRE